MPSRDADVTGRLTSAIIVSAMMRRVSGEGGNAMVIARGDPEAGAILVVCMARGVVTSVIERVRGPDDRLSWDEKSQQVIQNEQETGNYIARRRAHDSDLWVVELDIANAERFAAETIDLA
jgi:hypothetical protein